MSLFHDVPGYMFWPGAFAVYAFLGMIFWLAMSYFDPWLDRCLLYVFGEDCELSEKAQSRGQAFLLFWIWFVVFAFVFMIVLLATCKFLALSIINGSIEFVIACRSDPWTMEKFELPKNLNQSGKKLHE